MPNRISIGIEDQVIRVESEASLGDYGKLLETLYPESRRIAAICDQIRGHGLYEGAVRHQQPHLSGHEEDREYFLKKVLPWMVKYAMTVPKVSKRTNR